MREMTEDEQLLAQAISYAACKHAGQTRRDGTPYIYHPLHVAYVVKDLGYPIPYQIAAVLHDTLEDTDATEAEIRAFGDEAADAVLLLTRRRGMDEAVYVENILANPIAAVVKNADKVDNLGEAGFPGPTGSVRAERQKNWALTYADKAEKYYKGRFSRALDDAIDSARQEAQYTHIRDKGCVAQQISRESMRLYGDIE